ncbi:PH domain-containing protein [Chloroflexi bacterium TSY]|nr:PH domain-containing protein [Chloroflexi bacterium TSY]
MEAQITNQKLFSDSEQQADAKERTLFVGRPAIVYSAGQLVFVLCTFGLALIPFWLQQRHTKYYITNQRIIFEHGILSKTRKTLELFRVDDFRLVHPFDMRLLGYGKLEIHSSDRDIPDSELVGIPEIHGLYEHLRECMLNERERRNIRVWANA